MTNDGTSGATGVTLTDALPGGRDLRLGHRRGHAGQRCPDLPPRQPGRQRQPPRSPIVVHAHSDRHADQQRQCRSTTDRPDADEQQASATRPPPVADLVVTATASGNAPCSGDAGTQRDLHPHRRPTTARAAATGVTLTDTLPAGVTFVSATGGVTPVNGVLTFNLGTSPRQHHGHHRRHSHLRRHAQCSATAGMAQTDLNPADNSLTKSTTVTAVPPVVVDGPHVTNVQRFGFHARPTTLVLRFNEALDPTRAQDVANYRIVGPAASRSRSPQPCTTPRRTR